MPTPVLTTQLRNHSGYSLLESILQPDAIIELAKKDGLTSVGLTDNNNVIASLEFYEEALKNGIKPLIGCDTYIGEPKNSEKALLFAQDNKGWKNLSSILTDAARTQEKDVPYASIATISEFNSGVIAVLGGFESKLYAAAKNSDMATAKTIVQEWKAIFGDRLYIELQRVGRPEEAIVVQNLVNLCSEMGVPPVATHPTCFAERSDYYAHEVKSCINAGDTLSDSKRTRLYTPEQYWQTPAQMSELFADIPEAIENANQLALRCNLKMELGKSMFPPYPGTPDEQYAELRRLSAEGLNSNLSIFPEKFSNRKAYEDRLEYELNMIHKTGFDTYFLVVAEFIRWAKEQDIPVGPGRGSGAGSVVAYSLGITETDPVENGLMFERFINPDRVSLPDFDVDFCIERRSEVVEHCRQRYGTNSVAGIAAIGTLGAKAAIRDAVRVLGLPYTLGNSISNLIPKVPDITLDFAIEHSVDLQTKMASDKRVNDLINLARSIESLPRSVSQHAAGLVIAPGPVEKFAPLYKGSDGMITQYHKDDIEKAGLVKFDFLGLRTLTVLNKAQKSINVEKKAKGEDLIDLHALRENDPQVFEMYQSGNTQGIFQVEAANITKVAKDMKVSSFPELTDLLALYRPGPLLAGLVNKYVDRKIGKEAVSFDHPILEPLLKETQGIIVYQEQIMLLAQKLAGYTLGQADLLRRAMGKKKPEEMAKQRSIFVKGCFDMNGLNEKQATDIFNMVEKFAEYGFNKSHSAAYAQVSYRTAWCKKYHYAHYMCSEMDSYGKSEDIMPCIQDARRNGVTILPPDINASMDTFKVEKSVTGENQIRYSLSALKRVGAASRKIVVEREANGPFTSLINFAQRVGAGGGALRKDVLENLVRAGCFDQFNTNRAQLIETVEPLINALKKKSTKNSALGNPLGELFASTPNTELHIEVNDVPFWSEKEEADNEERAVGFHLQSDPYQLYARHLRTAGGWQEMETWKNEETVKDGIGAGFVEDMKPFRSGKGAHVFMTDGQETMRLTLFSDQWEACKSFVKKGEMIVFKGYKKTDARGESIIGNDVYTWDSCDPVFENEIRVSAEESGVKPILDYVRQQNAWDLQPKSTYGRKDRDAPPTKRLVIYQKKAEGWRAIAFQHPVNLTQTQLFDLENLTRCPVFIGKPAISMIAQTDKEAKKTVSKKSSSRDSGRSQTA